VKSRHVTIPPRLSHALPPQGSPYLELEVPLTVASGTISEGMIDERQGEPVEGVGRFQIDFS
jgi:hypothetical protein